MTSAIHPTRLRILAEVMRANQERQQPPTFRDLCALTGRSATYVARCLTEMKRDGLLTWEQNCTRTLRATVRVIVL